MLTVVFGVLCFTVVIVSLVVVLLLAKSRLQPSGKVEVLINDDPEKALNVDRGETLLGTLSANGIFIPSACGGKGTCGVCLVPVTEGGARCFPPR